MQTTYCFEHNRIEIVGEVKSSLVANEIAEVSAVTQTGCEVQFISTASRFPSTQKLLMSAEGR